jgi:hypothetical protein
MHYLHAGIFAFSVCAAAVMAVAKDTAATPPGDTVLVKDWRWCQTTAAVSCLKPGTPAPTYRSDGSAAGSVDPAQTPVKGYRILDTDYDIVLIRGARNAANAQWVSSELLAIVYCDKTSKVASRRPPSSSQTVSAVGMGSGEGCRQ